MAVRIETDGRVTVFAGADKRPIATAAPAVSPLRPGQPAGTDTAQNSLRAGSRRRRRHPGLDRRCRRDRSRRPRSARTRSQERQPHRRRPAQRQALDLRPDQCEPDAARAGRRHLSARIRQSRAALGAERGDAPARRRHPRGRHRGAQGFHPRHSAGAAAQRRLVRRRPAAIGEHPRRHLGRRHAASGAGPVWSRKPAPSSIATTTRAAWRSIAPNSSSIGMRGAVR